MDEEKQDNFTSKPSLEGLSPHLGSTMLIRRYRYMICGALLMIILLTLGNAFYLGQQIKSQVINEEDFRALEVMQTLITPLSISLNHVNKMRDSIESAHFYKQLTPGKKALDFIAQQAQGSPVNAPWENIPAEMQKKMGQLLVNSNAGDYSFDIVALLTMMPELIATHKQHSDFQWSYYYDVNKRLSLLYPWVSYKDLLEATATKNVDEALDVIYEAGGTFPVQLVNPKNNPAQHNVWTTPYMDAGGKKMMVSLIAPVYHLQNFVGAVGTDITLAVLDDILTTSYLHIGHLAIVDQQGLIIGDSQGALAGKTESVFQKSVLAQVSVGEAHLAEHRKLQRTETGYWFSYQLQGTPWKLVLEITDTKLQAYVVKAILPYLAMGIVFAILLLAIVFYQHRSFSEPALKLALFIEELPLQANLTFPDIPQKWFYWFERVATTEQDRRDYFNTIKKQTHELELRVEERTKKLKCTLEVLKATQDELVHSEKMSGLGSMVAGVAHELNTPIGNALLAASSLQAVNREFIESTKEGIRRSVLDNYVEQSRESSDCIARNLHLAAELISSFKQVAVDQSSHQRREFNLSEILHELRVTMAPNLSKDGITLQEDNFSNIEMDSYPGAITQVLMNLFSNASVHAFSNQSDRHIMICCSLVSDYGVAITVTDNGHGIATENINKVFDPFFTTRLGEGGSGLGLNIVYNVVTGILGGEISVTSELEQGCAFTLKLPLTAPESGES